MTPPNKRQRTLSVAVEFPERIPAPEVTLLTRSKDIYLKDGNIILAAESVAFRVHCSYLSRHSEVFRDMLELGDQRSAGEFFDDCPVVRLSDTSQDVLELLRVCYDHCQFWLSTTSQLISIIRLSSKYIMDSIRIPALGALAHAFPSQLRHWDAYEGPRLNCSGVIRLGHEINVDVLLPSAYYHLCSISTRDIVALHLPPFVFEIYCCGKEKILKCFANFLEHFLVYRLPSEDCQQDSCPGFLQEMQGQGHTLLRDSVWMCRPNPLICLTRMTESIFLSSMCRFCREELLDVIAHERAEIWNSLPEIFGLGSWDKLIS